MRALVNGVFKDLPGRERAPREDPHRVREDPLGTPQLSLPRKSSENLEEVPRIWEGEGPRRSKMSMFAYRGALYWSLCSVLRSLSAVPCTLYIFLFSVVCAVHCGLYALCSVLLSSVLCTQESVPCPGTYSGLCTLSQAVPCTLYSVICTL